VETIKLNKERAKAARKRMLSRVFQDSKGANNPKKKQKLEKPEAVNGDERARVSCYFEITAQLSDLNAEQLRRLAEQMKTIAAQMTSVK